MDLPDPSTLALRTPEASLLHILNLVLTLEYCDHVRKGHGWHCWYTRAALVLHTPAIVFSALSLYRIHRST
jgi:hypothetical protein